MTGKTIAWDLACILEQVQSVCRVTEDGCWIWEYGVWSTRPPASNNPYPRITISKKQTRVSWLILEASGRPREGDAFALHSCDSPRCVSPDHLRWGTHADNVKDAKERKRFRGASPGEDHWMKRYPERIARGDRNGARTHPEKRPRGEKHAQAIREGKERKRMQ